MDEFEWVKSFSASGYDSSYGRASEDTTSPSEYGVQSLNESQVLVPRGSFSSFICHTTHLERKLRSFTPLVLDSDSSIKPTGKFLGQGRTFVVRHALWAQKPDEPPIEVALKEIVPSLQSLDNSSRPLSDNQPPQNDWKDILFELRALLHEPIRYHPNLVRLLGLQWGLSPLSESTYPILVMEYAMGTFRSLQAEVEPLPFATKQKLCYDVGRALTALHACGIVHGDMKHENVLIYKNGQDGTGVPYIAKLADFGGTVMDMIATETRKLETWTWPFQAPEVEAGAYLSREGMMKTDIYSFGLLLWRAFNDGRGFVSQPGAAQSSPDAHKRALSNRKATDEFTRDAIADAHACAATTGLPASCLDIFVYAIINTVRLDPGKRGLIAAQAALRGIPLGKIHSYKRAIEEKNEKRDAQDRNDPPGRHAITRDSLAFFLGRSGQNVDLQDNLPGFRPQLSSPDVESFMFDPESLKSVLTWQQQQQMLVELKDAAKHTNTSRKSLLDIGKTTAAFYLFQCHLLEFGTPFNPKSVVDWLEEASSDDDSHEDSDYLAQAWLFRVACALGIIIDLPRDRFELLLKLSVMRGHKTCLQDLQFVAARTAPDDSRQLLSVYTEARHFLLTNMGAVGMGYFFPKLMTKVFDLEDLNQLDAQIRQHLGGAQYEACLRPRGSPLLKSPGKDERTAFDRIYVNVRGHGLLHYAAATGNVTALSHLLLKYKCDINLPNQHVDETPLVCACAAGQVACVEYLLEQGANPNGYRFGQEGGLHWLCSFLPKEMENIASRLIAAGADIERHSRGMRHDVRGIRADWEHLFEINVTPLGRSVLMNSLDAVKVLLKHGANPLATTANKHPEEYEGLNDVMKTVSVSSPFELAAVLTHPSILEEFNRQIDRLDPPSTQPSVRLIDEATMLDLAHDKEKVTKHDTLSLQSRLVRCGINYKTDLQRTIQLLFTRAQPWNEHPDKDLLEKRSRVLCREIALGNLDIVECLLLFGYNANGTKDFRPLEHAIRLNHIALFQLLVKFKVDLKTARSTATGMMSMLHLCASRPHQSRPGREIADALISAGVPTNGIDERVKSPFALAVLNQNFDVAEALLERGADINQRYPVQFNGARGPETRSMSVLVELLATHNMRTLESLRFLLGQQEGSPKHTPDFFVDKENKFTILHLLAGSELFTEIAQITPLIMNLVLDTYREPDFINFKNPILGTPLYYAASSGNKAMVERLLEKHADTGSTAGPQVSDSVQLLLRSQETWTPLWAAMLRYDEELNKIASQARDGPSAEKFKSNLFQNLDRILDLLSHTADTLATQAIGSLHKRRNDLQTEYEALAKAKKMKQHEGDENAVVLDLGVLSSNGDEDVNKMLAEAAEMDWIPAGFRGLLSSLSETRTNTLTLR